MQTSWYITRVYFCNPDNAAEIDHLINEGYELEEEIGPVQTSYPDYLPFLYQVEIGNGDSSELDNLARKRGFKLSGHNAEEAYANIMAELVRKLPDPNLPILYHNFLEQEVNSMNYLDQLLRIKPTSKVRGKLIAYKNKLDTEIIRYFGRDMLPTIVKTIPDIDIFMDAFAVEHILSNTDWRIFYTILEILENKKDFSELELLLENFGRKEQVLEFVNSLNLN